MESSVWSGIFVAVVMIFFMFLPNFLFKVPENHEEIRDEYIKRMIKLSEQEIEKELEKEKYKQKEKDYNDTWS
jgi:AAA+ ATPase superfamily predicted ATPase